MFLEQAVLSICHGNFVVSKTLGAEHGLNSCGLSAMVFVYKHLPPHSEQLGVTVKCGGLKPHNPAAPWQA